MVIHYQNWSAKMRKNCTKMVRSHSCTHDYMSPFIHILMKIFILKAFHATSSGNHPGKAIESPKRFLGGFWNSFLRLHFRIQKKKMNNKNHNHQTFDCTARWQVIMNIKRIQQYTIYKHISSTQISFHISFFLLLVVFPKIVWMSYINNICNIFSSTPGRIYRLFIMIAMCPGYSALNKFIQHILVFSFSSCVSFL